MAEIIEFFDHLARQQEIVDERIQHLILYNTLLKLIKEHGILNVLETMEEVEACTRDVQY